MAQAIDTSAIRRLISWARRRIRTQRALDGAVTAMILAALLVAATTAAARAGWIEVMTAAIARGVALAIVAAGALISAAGRLDDELVARRIDRASGLADRLSTAVAFARPDARHDDTVTRDLMDAAIRDGVRATARADVRAATPYQRPKQLKAALGALVTIALALLVEPCTTPHTAHLVRARPDFGPPGAHATIDAEYLSPVPGNVFLGSLAKSRPITVLDWTPAAIDVKIPDDAPIGDAQLLVFAAGHSLGAVPFKVVDKKDIRYHREDSVALDPDEKAYVEAILAQLRDVAKRDQVPELDEFAKKLEQLLGQAENGEITKEQLLDALAKAEEALNKDAEPNQDEVDKKLADMGKELAKDPVTKDLGEALEKKDLEKAQQELEKLADKLEKKELTPQQKDELGKKLDQVAKQMEKQDQQDQKKQDQQEQKLEQQVKDLEKQAKDAKTDQQRADLERRLDDKKRELAKLQKEQEQKDQSDQRRALKRLQKDMEKAAENLEKPQKDQSGKDQDQNDENEQQASQKLKDAARETGRVDKDQRKQATQKKMSSQMDDLREAMRRAKQKGSKGPQDPFNKQGKNSDFAQRARGQKSGQGQSWKPGQQPGQGQGQGQGSNGNGSGAQQGGDTWGVGHDDNLEGDSTAKSGNTKDTDVQGVTGDKGGSTRETILAAAQKGFASQGYQKVYADYQRIVEEVMRTEKLPSSYKYYVKRYFAKIHPSMLAPAEDKK